MINYYRAAHYLQMKIIWGIAFLMLTKPAFTKLRLNFWKSHLPLSSMCQIIKKLFETIIIFKPSLLVHLFQGMYTKIYVQIS